jgi:hypothetical protein
VSPAEVCRGCRERVVAVRREGEVSATEGIDEVRAPQRGGGLFGRIMLVYEGTAREETDRLRHGRLQEAAKLRMRRAVCGQDLAESEESGDCSVWC